ncbi:hypothetical protein ACIQU4_27245 [Streptomyces sp. NPDC090741]|uniref:hypothetical protein n=1 Tax=Streptomyces sp. NPDC090741 TaxID=3365967 RepID=UPI0037F8B17E
MVLTPPFEPMLAQAAEYLPGSGVLASGFAAEQKLWTGLVAVRCPLENLGPLAAESEMQ